MISYEFDYFNFLKGELRLRLRSALNEFHSLITLTLNILPSSVFLLYRGKLELRLQKPVDQLYVCQSFL